MTQLVSLAHATELRLEAGAASALGTMDHVVPFQCSKNDFVGP